jgi:hypothetical protein
MEEETRAPEVRGRFGIAGYVAAAIGAVLGAFGLAAAGVGLGFAYSDRFMPDAGLEAFTPVVIGLITGAALGAGLGSWLGVAAVGQSHPALTGAVTAVIVPPIPWFLYRLSDTLESQWLQVGLWLGAIALASVLARAVTAPVARAALREEQVAAALWLISIVEIFLVIRAVLFL